jgi:hypothetical protein
MRKPGVSATLWVIVVLLIFGIGFGPAYVAGRSDVASLRLDCAAARRDINKLEAIRLTLKSEALIAGDLGLPIAHELREYVATFSIPKVSEISKGL